MKRRRDSRGGIGTGFAALIGAVLGVVGAIHAGPAAAAPVDYQMVTVGDAGNAADTTGYGAVGYEYRIGKYEWTNALYADFLNAVDPEGTNPNSIYNPNMGTNIRFGAGISYTAGNASGMKYSTLPNMGDKPVNFVNWWDAARVANWLQNGARTYSNSNAMADAPQNTGAYTLGTATGGAAPARNAGVQYWVPTENEWYKAAYYAGGGTNAGYWAFATQSNANPIAVGATAVGVGSIGGVSPVVTGNYANFDFQADWNGQDGNATTVGTNGGPGAYGTFDMSGNVYEWNDLDGVSSPNRGIRGGDWTDGVLNQSSSNHAAIDASVEGLIGFRLASSVESSVPEIDPAGLGSVLALVGGAAGIAERRRSGRTCRRA